jgi:hypothetical protein
MSAPKSTKAASPSKRKNRPRPTPSWLKQQQDLNDVARRRCLMILEVLSGAVPVSEAIETALISRGLYYQLETKAVRAMLAALEPGTDPAGEPAVSASEKITQLEEKVTRLERDKRRIERLLFVTKLVVKPGPVAMPSKRGRKKGVKLSSTQSGSKPSPSSTSANSLSSSPSTPTPAGAGARSSGSGN